MDNKLFSCIVTRLYPGYEGADTKILLKVNQDISNAGTIVIPSDVDVIYSSAFKELKSCKVVINSPEICIEKGAFEDSENVIVVISSEELCYPGIIIKPYAFAGSRNLTVDIANEYSITTINSHAFSGVRNLSLHLGKEFTLNELAFEYVCGLTISWQNFDSNCNVAPGAFDGVEDLIINGTGQKYHYADNILYTSDDLNHRTILYTDTTENDFLEIPSNFIHIARQSINTRVNNFIFWARKVKIDEDPLFISEVQEHADGIIFTVSDDIERCKKSFYSYVVYNLESKNPELLADCMSYWNDVAVEWVMRNYIYLDPKTKIIYNKTKTRLIGKNAIFGNFVKHSDIITDIGKYQEANPSTKCNNDFYPGQKKDDYIQFNEDGEERVYVPDSVGVICNRAFYDYTNLRRIRLPEYLYSIGEESFYNCSSLEEIIIPRGVQRISKYSFSNCASLKKIVLPDTLLYIDEYSFSDCDSLFELEIPSSVIEIDITAFRGTRLKKLTINGNPIFFENGAKIFREDDFLSELVNVKQLKISKNFIDQFDIRNFKLDRLELHDSFNYSFRNRYYMFLDTETTGVPSKFSKPGSDSYPRLVQLAYIIVDSAGNELLKVNNIIKPDGFNIPKEAQSIHGITTKDARQKGYPLNAVIENFLCDLNWCSFIIGHNVVFDIKVIQSELIKNGFVFDLESSKPIMCTMKMSKNYCKETDINGRLKYPTLQQLYYKLFGKYFEEAHNAMNDVEATKECFFKLKQILNN